MILVDTSVWIDFLIGRDTPFRHRLHYLIETEEDICLTEIILTEILQGIKDDSDYALTRNYLLQFPFSSAKGLDTYIAAADIYRKCRKAGKTIRKTVDCIIASIALENSLILLHNDSDFEIIKICVGLKTFDVA